LKWTSCKYIIK